MTPWWALSLNTDDGLSKQNIKFHFLYLMFEFTQNGKAQKLSPRMLSYVGVKKGT